MRCLALLAVHLFSLANARVTFPYSEVLQALDIAGTNKANFKCKNQCTVFADRKSDKLVITQDDRIIAYFTNTILSQPGVAPTGVLLPPGDDYYVENRGDPNPEFVLYIVDSKAPNYGASVYSSQENLGIAVKDSARYVTILSSFEAMWFSGFSGAFPDGWPRIYATPYDAVGETCSPVYQARSQYNAEMSWPTIASAVFTIDFGFVGAHNVSVNNGKIKDMSKSAGMSVVYTSPGYVGCSKMPGQNYYSKLNSVQDSYTLKADSLDIVASYNGITAEEPIQFTVNGKKNNFVGTDTYGDSFDKDTFDVSLSWQRKTQGSSFAMQLDCGNTDEQPQSTTKTGRSLSALAALALVIAACLR